MHGLKHLIFPLQQIVDGENGRHVAAAVAVVGRRPHRDQRAREHLLVALHDKLVRPRNERDVVATAELVGLGLAKQVAGAARRHRPRRHLLRVRPEKIAHGALVRHLLLAVKHADLVDGFHVGAEAAVDAENAALAAHHRTQQDVVKHLAAVAPHIDAAVLAETLVVETVDGGDLAQLVVAADERDLVRIADLERQQQEQAFQRVEAAVDKVAEENVLGLRTLATRLEKRDEVVQLAVDVAADGHGRVELLDVGLFDEDFDGFAADLLDMRLGDVAARLDVLDGSGVSGRRDKTRRTRTFPSRTWVVGETR